MGKVAKSLVFKSNHPINLLTTHNLNIINVWNGKGFHIFTGIDHNHCHYPLMGTQVSYFKRSLLEPNLMPSRHIRGTFSLFIVHFQLWVIGTHAQNVSKGLKNGIEGSKNALQLSPTVCKAMLKPTLCKAKLFPWMIHPKIPICLTKRKENSY